MNSDQTSPPEPDDKTAFGHRYLATQARLFRRNVLVAAAVYVGFMSWDVVVAPSSIRINLAIRVGVVGICVLLFLASGLRSFKRWYNWYYVALIASAGISVGVILWFVPQGFAIGVAGVLLCIAASSAIFRASGWVTAVAGVVTTLGVVALMVIHEEPDYLVRSNAIFLVAAVGFAVLHNVQSRRNAYEVFRAQERLEGEKARTQALLGDLSTMHQERLTWLENLARFLRHELKNQIVGVSTSIDLAQEGDSATANRIYLSRAQRSLNRMRALVSSATEATSLEAAMAIDDVERVDWSGVVVDRVSAFQQLNASRNVTLKLRPGLSVDGNEDRLAQLLDKLLANALEHSSAESEIRVELRRAGGEWLELTLENEGEALPKDKERIFEAFVSSQGSADNLGLGLFVAQSVALNHGGDIVAEDLPRDRGARFVVRLPEACENARGVDVEDAGLAPAWRARPDEDQPPQ